MLRSLEPGSLTVVVLMGLATRAETAALLLSRGWAPETPAAVLLSASTLDAHTWRGTLLELGDCPLPPLHPDAPGMLVVGVTVAVAERLECVAAAAAQSDPPQEAEALKRRASMRSLRIL